MDGKQKLARVIAKYLQGHLGAEAGDKEGKHLLEHLEKHAVIGYAAKSPRPTGALIQAILIVTDTLKQPNLDANARLVMAQDLADLAAELKG